tara:strand:- start:5462 stop:6232 length:771 start_codon:yes stop_codon:yes gene_type:complete
MESNSLKNCLITGGAKRIGKAIVENLVSNGWNVAIHCHNSIEDAKILAKNLSSKQIKVVSLDARLDVYTEMLTLVKRATEALGPITCLINNASVFDMDQVGQITETSWAKHMAVNLSAPLFLSQEFFKCLNEQQSGNIVNIIDQRVWSPTPWFISYATSKAGLWSLTQSLALALAPRIRVNAIGPGPTLQSKRQTKEDFQAQSRATPLQKGATPNEIASAIRFILSSKSMTGQMIALDGGQHLGWEYSGNKDCPQE